MENILIVFLEIYEIYLSVISVYTSIAVTYYLLLPLLSIFIITMLQIVLL